MTQRTTKSPADGHQQAPARRPAALPYPGKTPTLAAGSALTTFALLMLALGTAYAEGTSRGAHGANGSGLVIENGDQRLEVGNGCVRIEGDGQSLVTGDCRDGGEDAEETPRTDGSGSPRETLQRLVEGCEEKATARMPASGETAVVREPTSATEGGEGQPVAGNHSAEQCRSVLRVVSDGERLDRDEEETLPEDAGPGSPPSQGQYGDAQGETTVSEPTDETTRPAPQETTETTEITETTRGDRPSEDGPASPGISEATTVREGDGPDEDRLPRRPVDEGAAGGQYGQEEFPEATSPALDASGSAGPPVSGLEPVVEAGDTSGGVAPDPDYPPSSSLPTESGPDGPVTVLPDTGGPAVLLPAGALATVFGTVLVLRRFRGDG